MKLWVINCCQNWGALSVIQSFWSSGRVFHMYSAKSFPNTANSCSSITAEPCCLFQPFHWKDWLTRAVSWAHSWFTWTFTVIPEVPSRISQFYNLDFTVIFNLHPWGYHCSTCCLRWPFCACSVYFIIIFGFSLLIYYCYWSVFNFARLLVIIARYRAILNK